MTRDRWFILLAAVGAVMLSVTLNHDWPRKPPAELSHLVYPEEIIPGQDIEIKGRLRQISDPNDCIVGASLVVQLGGRLSFTRWTATRTVEEDAVAYVIPVPKMTKPGPARIFIRESYFCENRNRVAFVNGADTPTIIKGPKPAADADLPKDPS